MNLKDIENKESINKTFATIFLIAGVAFLFLLIYLTIPFLSPFVLFGAVLFLLFPFRQNEYVRRLIWLTTIIFIIWLSSTLIGVLIPFIIAFILAYILNPMVNRLEKKNIPRWLSSIVIMSGLVGAIILFFIIAMPIVLNQFQSMIGNISGFVLNTVDSLKQGTLFDLLRQAGFPVESLREILEKELPSRLESILKSLFEGAFGLISSISIIITQLLNIVIIPFVAFYLLKDFPDVLDTVQSFIPESQKQKIINYFIKVDEVLSDYLRGAIIVAIIQGIISTIVLSLLGVKYALVLGIMTALLDFIPYVGLIISMIVATLAAMFSGDPMTGRVIGVIIMYLSQKIFENTILAPKIIGEKVGLHPVLLIISLFIFSHFFGFVGLLIAVPTTAIIIMSVKLWKDKKIAISISENISS
ncbi:MAG: AI-2E family transporter [Ignavibacteriales bacterium]|nr:AI-2E family transporter [Ignavibacteriales bacterium]